MWSDAVKRHVIDNGLPIPAIDTDIRRLSAEHLEARAVHAAKFHDNWYSKQPAPRRAVEFRVERPSESGPGEVLQTNQVEQVLFLRGRNGEFLITLAGGVITCWELPLDGSEAYRVAEHKDDQRIRQVLVNEDPKNNVELAYSMFDDRV